MQDTIMQSAFVCMQGHTGAGHYSAWHCTRVLICEVYASYDIIILSGHCTIIDHIAIG